MQTDHALKSGGKRLNGILPQSSLDQPLVSVVTVVFNGAKNLRATIESVLGQTYGNIEYIIIDGGSTDETLEILRKYEQVIDYWLSEPDKGVYDAFNKACSLIRGEWTLFLGSGDVLHDAAVVETIALAAREVPQDTELLYGKVSLTNDECTVVKILNRPWERMRGQWRGGRPMLPHHQGVFHRKTLLATEKPFDTSYRIAADSKLIYGSIRRVSPIFCDVVVTRAPLGGVSTEPRYFMSTAHEIIRINHEFGHTKYGHQLWFYFKCLSKSLLYSIGGKAYSKKWIDKYRVLTGRNPKWAR